MSEVILSELMQQIRVLQAQLDRQRHELAELKARPPEPGPTPTSRRRVLRRLASSLIAGLALGGTTLANGSPAQAATIINPAIGNNQIGAIIVPPGKPIPPIAPLSYYYGLVVTDGTISSDPTPATNAALTAAALGTNAKGIVTVVTGQNSYALYSLAGGTGSFAGGFVGDVSIVGTLSKTGGSFKIDHPLDPANRYLYHSFVESPDMLNIYNGVVTLDVQGRATVALPAWFEALNADFRYSLTALGQPAPDLHIAQKIKEGKFVIAGGQPGQEVSWLLTGIRQDEWAKAHRIPVEEAKPDHERGLYLHPELYGQPPEKALHRLK